MILTLYSALMGLLQPWLRRKLRQRALAEPVYGIHIGQRFGNYADVDWKPAPLRIWLHAVSLGETRAAAILLAELRQAYPKMQLVLTHGTATGRQQGLSLLREGDVQVWQPWDTPAAVTAFLGHFEPTLGLLLETEIWPNWVALCHKRGVPLYLVNARLSEKSLRQAQRLAWLARPAYTGLTAVWAQSADDARRLALLGAPVRGVTGNLKFDAQPDPLQRAQAAAWRGQLARPVVVFASSREGEETMFLDALAECTAPQRASVQWLIVPRHPQRFAEVAALISTRGYSLSRRSQWTDTPQPAEVWLGDSLGEMALYYGLSELVLLGGSFAPLGGQNLIEAAACGCLTLTGPHTFNFAEASMQAVAAGAAIRVADLAGALTAALQLLEDKPALAQSRAKATQWSQAHRGAAQRTVSALVEQQRSNNRGRGRL